MGPLKSRQGTFPWGPGGGGGLAASQGRDWVSDVQRAGTEMQVDLIKGTREGPCSVWGRGSRISRAREGGHPGVGGTNSAEPESVLVVGLAGAGDEGRRGAGPAGSGMSSGLRETQEIPVRSVWSLRTHPESRLMWPRSVLQRLRMRMGVPRALMPSATRDDTFTSAASCRRPPRGLGGDPTPGLGRAARLHPTGPALTTPTPALGP